jgi:hypothetical protein
MMIERIACDTSRESDEEPRKGTNDTKDKQRLLCLLCLFAAKQSGRAALQPEALYRPLLRRRGSGVSAEGEQPPWAEELIGTGGEPVDALLEASSLAHSAASLSNRVGEAPLCVENRSAGSGIMPVAASFHLIQSIAVAEVIGKKGLPA